MTIPRRNPAVAVAKKNVALFSLIYTDLPDMPNAPCREDPEAWFPNPTASAKRPIDACRNTCPHQVACLERALSMPFNPHGIWGGTTEGDRRKIIARRARKAA